MDETSARALSPLPVILKSTSARPVPASPRPSARTTSPAASPVPATLMSRLTPSPAVTDPEDRTSPSKAMARICGRVSTPSLRVMVPSSSLARRSPAPTFSPVTVMSRSAAVIQPTGSRPVLQRLSASGAASGASLSFPSAAGVTWCPPSSANSIGRSVCREASVTVPRGRTAPPSIRSAGVTLASMVMSRRPSLPVIASDMPVVL